MRAFGVTFRISCLAFILALTACGGGSGSAPTPPPPAPLGVQLSASTVTVLQDGTPAPVTVTVTQPAGDSSAVTLSATSLPTGVTAQIVSPGSGSSGTLTFTAQQPTVAAAGSYTVGIGASDSVTSGSTALTLVVGIVATVGATVDISSGVNGQLNLFMSTSFYLGSCCDQLFVTNPGAATPLQNLGSQHIRLQVLERDIPQDSANTWNNFPYLDGVVSPVHSVADHSPEFQIAKGPAFMYDANGNLLDQTFQSFAQYAANLVRYYN